MSDQDTRSKRYDEIQREKKLRRRLPNIKYKKPKIVEQYKLSPVDIKQTIEEALDNLEL